MGKIAAKVLSVVELRAHWNSTHELTYYIDDGVIVTPAANDFLREHDISLCRTRQEKPSRTMTVTPLPTHNGRVYFQNALTGEKMTEKGEGMTHLRGNLLVPKTDPRIAFRGRLDSLMAQLMDVQLTAMKENDPQIAEALQEMLEYIRKILACEVKDEPLGEVKLLGMDSRDIRRASHHVKETLGIDHPVPDYRMGRLCVSLNRLRTQVRETELYAAAAFMDASGNCSRMDLIEGLNRLSSCVYILFCRKAAGYYD